MAQLNQIIWSNITWGACGIFFMCLFGIAIKFEWNSQLTPKAWNRPRNVLKNVLKEHTIFGCWNLYPVTWFLWARKLTYPAGMEGIPGTGTRDDGWSGPTLKMNLDGVILLKFHRMLFKIGVLATLLCCGVLLPTYTSSVCDPEIVTERECQRLASLTDFENLTISRVPEVRRNEKNTKRVRDNNSNSHIINSKNKNKTQSLLLDDDQFLSFESSVGTTKSTPQLLDEGGNIIIPSAPVAPETNADTKWVPGISWRLITTALCSAIIYAYTCCKFSQVQPTRLIIYESRNKMETKNKKSHRSHPHFRFILPFQSFTLISNGQMLNKTNNNNHATTITQQQ